jgi:hypothetical protein
VPVPVDLPAKAQPRERWLTRSEAARLLLGALDFKLARSPHFHSSNAGEKIDIGRINEINQWRIIGRPGERNRHVARFILLGLYTGTRHDAILGLGWLPQIDGGHVDLEQGLIYRRGAGERVTKKRRPPVPIDERLGAPTTYGAGPKWLPAGATSSPMTVPGWCPTVKQKGRHC